MRRMLTLLAAGVLLLAACGGGETDTPAAQGEDAQEEETSSGTEVMVATSDLGDVLADADGNTLYMFVPDEDANGESTCYDDCAEAWPALEASGEPTAGEGVDGSMLGTTERDDGTQQVTYNDLPLYYFSGDESAGDTNGQGINDVWWVLSPEGEPIRDAGQGGGGGGDDKDDKEMKDEPY